MRHIKSKKVLLALFVLLLLSGLVAAAFFTESGSPDYMQKIYPDQQVRDAGDKHFKVGSMDVFVTRISIGDTVLHQIYEKDDEKYRFFTTEEEPRLLKEVEVITPLQNADEALNKNFFLRDITNDGIEELFVRVLNSGSNLSEWEILKLEDGALVNIAIKGQKDNPNWVEFDKIETRGSRIWLSWHGSDMKGWNSYELEGNELVFQRTVRLTFKNGSDMCDVSVFKLHDELAQFIETFPCNEDRYEYYLLATPEELNFRADLFSAKSDPALEYLAQTYDQTCDRNPIEPVLRKVSTFRGLVQSAEQIKPSTDGTHAIILPCGRSAYQSWFIPVLYDGSAYRPLKAPTLTEQGETQLIDSLADLWYDPETDLFGSATKYNGLNTCWDTATYKLVGKELVLQKFEADWECDDGEMDGKVIFDVNNPH